MYVHGSYGGLPDQICQCTYADKSSIEQLIPSLILDNHMKTLRYLGNEKQSGYVARCSFCGTKSLIANAYHD